MFDILDNLVPMLIMFMLLRGILDVLLGKKKRRPEDAEQEACIGYLRSQIALVNPKIIVCLGRIAARQLIDRDFRITRQRGQWIQKDGIWMMAIYHPSALLRDVGKRPETFDDLISLREKIRQLGARV